MKSRLSLLTWSLLCLSTSMAFTQIPADSIPPLVDSLIQVSRAHTGDAEFEQASTASKLAGEEAIRCCGENSAAYAAYLFNEGRILDFMGRLKESLPWYIQSRELRGKVLGTDHVEYGKSCNNLAITYDVMGRYEEAEPLYREVLAIREVVYGRRSKTCAAVLSNLGGMYISMREYDKAEQIILEALDIRKEILGEKDQQYGQSLILLASYYKEINNLEDAKPVLLKAKEIYDSQDQLFFYDYVGLLEHLGTLYILLDDLETAETYLTEAANLIEEVLGKENRLYLNSLNYLSNLARKAEQLDESEAYLHEELAILAQLDYEDDEYYALALRDLSHLYHIKGDVEQGLNTLGIAIGMLNETVPPEHLWYREALSLKAGMQQTLSNYQEAADILRRIADLEQKPLGAAVRHLSAQELSAFTREYYEDLAKHLAIAEHFPDITDLFYDKVLLYKGFLLNNTLAVRKNAQHNETTQALYQQLRGLHRRLAILYSDYKADEEEIKELEHSAELVEKELVRQQADYQKLSFDLNWQKLQITLASNEAALELVTYQKSTDINQEEEKYYAGLLLLPDGRKPIFLGLGTEEGLANLLGGNTNNTAAINGLYQWEVNGQLLYELVWQPIQEALEKLPEIEKLYVAGDGLIHRLNIGAIPTTDGKVVAQHYEIAMLTSTRNLLTPQTNEDTEKRSAILYGGIEYGQIDQTTTPSSAASESTSTSQTRAYTSSLRGYDPNQGYWQSLPWTEVEIEYANDVLQTAGYETAMFTSTAATEAELKRILQTQTAPEVIHLATHGYFFEPPDISEKISLLPFEQAEEDLIRSGLILANGNYAWINGRSIRPEEEDGILTALEVSQLELDETELFILSACETGLGKIRQTEGVYGLQRALKLAGVEYIIISLWQVPDYQAQAFMSGFYTAWLEEERSIPEAFNNAQAYMRARYKNPFEWAGFVLIQ
ncbi:MAG: CHAT domain-containing tetratricopeptide repeat protein [Bacteroidota bacterium]